jgi:5-methylcytosine-specific restriction endonuclease McrA
MGRDYHRPYASNWYRQRRDEYRAILGGKCAHCGTDEGLQFDHINWRTKSFCIAKLMSVKQERAREELKKCQLLCHPCHVIKNRSDRAERAIWKREPGGHTGADLKSEGGP